MGSRRNFKKVPCQEKKIFSDPLQYIYCQNTYIQNGQESFFLFFREMDNNTQILCALMDYLAVSIM